MTFSTKLPALSGLPQKQSKNQAMPLNSQFSILNSFPIFSINFRSAFPR